MDALKGSASARWHTGDDDDSTTGKDLMMSKDPRWQFKELGRNDEREDPVHEEFFREDDLADALVGEDTQNRLDARSQEQKVPVRIRYTFLRGDVAVSSDVSRRYLSELRPHLEKAHPHGLPSSEAPMTCLLIEGFGTTGLTGDPKQYSDSDDPSVSKNNFYYFYRNKGRSPKSDTDRGRWGVGKVVYTESSRIRSFFGYTLRENDRKSLLMGKSILKVHKLGDSDYSPNGYYAKFAEKDGFALPVEQDTLLNDFRSDFSLSRSDESGLSIVIPYPDDSITPESVLRSMIARFFYPIMNQDLVLEIAEDGGNVKELSYETIRQFVGDLDWAETDTSSERLLKLLDFAEWVLTLPDPDHVETQYIPGEDSSPVWDEDLFAEDELEQLRERFLDGDRLVFRIPVKVKRYEQEDLLDEDSYFKICIERDQKLSKPEEHYIREGLTISHIRQLRNQGVRALLVVEDPALSKLIGDSENPSHTDWKERAEKVLKKYGRYEQEMFTVRFVKQGIRQILSFLMRPPEGLFKDVMKDIFYIENPPEVGDNGSEDNDDGIEDSDEEGGEVSTEPEPDPDPGSQLQPFRVDRISGGIRIKRNAKADEMPESAVVEIAYNVGRGNPFKKCHPADFKLDELSVSHENTAIVKRTLNQLEFEIESSDFEVEITGFDQQRDLRVSVNPVGGNQ